MNAKRYANGVKWLGAHGFSASQDDEPCTSWTNKDGVRVGFNDYSSEWYASLDGWTGDDSITPKSAIGKLRKDFIQRRDEMFKEAQSYGEAAGRLGKVLEKENGKNEA